MNARPKPRPAVLDDDDHAARRKAALRYLAGVLLRFGDACLAAKAKAAAADPATIPITTAAPAKSRRRTGGRSR
jgi:hypothetical protein